MAFNSTWNSNPGKAKVQYPDTLGKRERHREFASENIDETLHRLDAAMAALGAGNGRS